MLDKNKKVACFRVFVKGIQRLLDNLSPKVTGNCRDLKCIIQNEKDIYHYYFKKIVY